jgi:flavin reductase (DIM6/NTAB) family NADH-FMN oxidoreductase RutF
MEFFIDCQFFAINFLSEGGETLSQQFASSEHLDKINWPEIIEFQGAPSCCPILKNSLAYLECENFKQYDGGDHLIFIGKVIHYDLLQGESNPLLYFRSNYRKIEAEQ